MSTPLTLFAEYPSWDSFFHAVDVYCEETFQPFVKTSSKKVSTHNKTHKSCAYPEDMVYFYHTLSCTHRGKFKPRGKGERETKSNKDCCKAKIHASLNKDNPRQIVVTCLIDKHNHEIGEHLYKRYAQNRALITSERAQAEKLCSLNVPNKDIRKELQAITGKSVTLQDVVNVKKGYRRKEKQAITGGVKLNDAQLLHKRLQMRREKDPGMSSDFGVDSNGELQYLFMQTSRMREMFLKFPEHILLDATYCVNDRLMPLISFIAVDGLNRSQLVAFAVVANEISYIMYDNIFETFKKWNAEFSLIKTFRVDKDFVSIAALQNHFPESKCELCLFHVKKTFKKKISNCPKKVQEDLMTSLERMCAAESVDVYERVRERLITLDSEFYDYFLRNWDCMRESWVKYARDGHVNLGDTTNNRIESYHQKIKTIITSPSSLDLFFNALMFYYDTVTSEHTHIDFSVVTKKSISYFPHLQRIITPFAIKKVESEFDKSNGWNITPHVDSYSVCKGDVNLIVDLNSCSCPFFQTMLNLPCRHVIALKKFLCHEPLVHADMFCQRWHIAYNCNCNVPETFDSGNDTVTDFDWQSRAMSKRDKYAICRAKCDKIIAKLVELGSADFTYYSGKLDEIDSFISGISRFQLVKEGPNAEIIGDERPGVDLLSVEKEEPVAELVVEEERLDTEVVGEEERLDTEVVGEEERVVGEGERPGVDIGVEEERPVGEERLNDHHGDFFTNLKLPTKVPKRGRPNDFGITVIGLPKRSRKTERQM